MSEKLREEHHPGRGYRSAPYQFSEFRVNQPLKSNYKEREIIDSKTKCNFNL